jgi:MoxR-like ATPase
LLHEFFVKKAWGLFPGDNLPKPISYKLIEPKDYISTSEMVNAVNVALIMNQPLLLTGEPGSGKTQLAHRVAWELGLGKPLTFETKSNSTARDLFYIFNTLARFHAAEIKKEPDDTAFITYQALGKAILLANHLDDVKNIYQMILITMVLLNARLC